MNQSILADPAYSIFRENLRLYKLAYFDSKFMLPNWKELIQLDEWAYEAELIKLKNDFRFLLNNAIRNDDSSKEKV